MTTFGKKLREARDAKGISQSELGRLLETNHSIIGKYERDEVKPTIDAIKRLADALGTSVGFLVDESGDSDIFKDTKMVKRLKDISSFPEADKDHILYIPGCVDQSSRRGRRVVGGGVARRAGATARGWRAPCE